MTTPSLWPNWVTTAQHRLLASLSTSFTWCVTQERGRLNRSVWGQWVSEAGPEINIALRDVGMSLVGVYPRGEGFWPSRPPESVSTPTAYAGTFNEVLSKAAEWRAERMPKRAEQEPQ
jgi:hypothetical protein